LAEQALVQVPDHESCRNWGQANLLKSRQVVLGAVAVLSTIVSFPDVALSIVMLWAPLTLLLTIIIKGAGFLVHITGQSHPPTHTLKNVSARLPYVSVMPPISRTQNWRCANQTTGKFHTSQTTSGYCSGP